MDEPIHVTNIKKAIVANLNMDISASRRAEINSNSIQVSFSNYYFSSLLAKFSNYDGFYFSKFQIPDEAVLEQAPLGQTYFSVREQSLHGIYHLLHPLIMMYLLQKILSYFHKILFFRWLWNCLYHSRSSRIWSYGNWREVATRWEIPQWTRTSSWRTLTSNPSLPR